MNKNKKTDVLSSSTTFSYHFRPFSPPRHPSLPSLHPRPPYPPTHLPSVRPAARPPARPVRPSRLPRPSFRRPSSRPVG